MVYPAGKASVRVVLPCWCERAGAGEEEGLQETLGWWGVGASAEGEEEGLQGRIQGEGVLATIREGSSPAGCGWWCACQLSDLPIFRLFDLSICWEVGKSESWRVGDLAGCERWVVVVYRRGKASAQEGVRKCCRVWDV